MPKSSTFASRAVPSGLVHEKMLSGSSPGGSRRHDAPRSLPGAAPAAPADARRTHSKHAFPSVHESVVPGRYRLRDSQPIETLWTRSHPFEPWAEVELELAPSPHEPSKDPQAVMPSALRSGFDTADGTPTTSLASGQARVPPYSALRLATARPCDVPLPRRWPCGRWDTRWLLFHRSRRRESRQAFGP
jgi:hypothetical protein